jgi:hypothetical protein
VSQLEKSKIILPYCLSFPSTWTRRNESLPFQRPKRQNTETKTHHKQTKRNSNTSQTKNNAIPLHINWLLFFQGFRAEFKIKSNIDGRSRSPANTAVTSTIQFLNNRALTPNISKFLPQECNRTFRVLTDTRLPAGFRRLQ